MFTDSRIYVLFKEPVHSSGNPASNGRIISEFEGMWKEEIVFQLLLLEDLIQNTESLPGTRFETGISQIRMVDTGGHQNARRIRTQNLH